MENAYKVLGLNGEEEISEIKKAYYNLIHIFEPEVYPDKFIEINKAYETIINNYNEGISSKYKEKFFIDLNILIENNDYGWIEKFVTFLHNEITLENYLQVNKSILDFIVLLIDKNYDTEALILAFLCEKFFLELSLSGLSEAYRRFCFSIVIRNKVM